MRACVIGWPIGHSRSPLIHNFWIAQHKLPALYEKRAVKPAELRDFLRNLEGLGLVGCNITIPHKEAAFSLVDHIDQKVESLGAINTVYVRNGRTFGTNTDGEGFMASIAHDVPGFDCRNQAVVIMGAGGAAASIARVLLDYGAGAVALVNRTGERAAALQRRLGNKATVVPWEQRAERLRECALLVNTTSLGMSGQPPLDLKIDDLPSAAVVADIVYDPLLTPLLNRAAERGHAVVGGLGMLLQQAVRGFELWFGIRPQVTRELYDLVARDIDPRRNP
jgi:shikimate dehydrogenase